MGIKRIIFFVESSFNQRDYDRFGIETLQKNGFEVEVWDFTPFLHPQVIDKVKVPDSINWKNCHSFLTWNDAFSAILKLPYSCFIVCLIGYQFKSFSVYRACLLYTSDAADDLLCVDLGGRRIIKKKKK